MCGSNYTNPGRGQTVETVKGSGCGGGLGRGTNRRDTGFQDSEALLYSVVGMHDSPSPAKLRECAKQTRTLLSTLGFS